MPCEHPWAAVQLTVLTDKMERGENCILAVCGVCETFLDPPASMVWSSTKVLTAAMWREYSKKD